MKSLRLNVGGPAYLKKLRELNPTLAKGVEKLRSQFKGENLATFDKRGGYQFAAYQNMPEEQQKAFIEDMASKYSSPDEDLIAETTKSLGSDKYTPVYRYASATKKKKPTVETDIYKQLGMAKDGGLKEDIKKIKTKKMVDGGLARGGGEAIKGLNFKGVF